MKKEYDTSVKEAIERVMSVFSEYIKTTPYFDISCVANFDSARVEIYIDQGDYDKNRAVYRLLETHRSEIETAYGKALTWVCQEGVRGCRIYDKMTEVSITKEDDWDAMIAFHTQQAKKLLSAMQPFWT